MKKTLIAVLITISLMLVSCNETATYNGGIEKYTEGTKSARIVKIAGELYYDTGTINTASTVAGRVDGKSIAEQANLLFRMKMTHQTLKVNINTVLVRKKILQKFTLIMYGKCLIK